MILQAETSLLIAVKRRLTDAMNISEDHIDIELDDTAPAMTSQVFFAISPAQASQGRYSGTYGAPAHDMFGARVAILMRMGNVPKDRQRTSAFLDRLSSINSLLSEVSQTLRQDYTTIEIANAELLQMGIDGTFTKPLVPLSIDQKPRMATGDIYDAGRQNSGGHTQVVMVRGINFGNAEFIGKME